MKALALLDDAYEGEMALRNACVGKPRRDTWDDLSMHAYAASVLNEVRMKLRAKPDTYKAASGEIAQFKRRRWTKKRKLKPITRKAQARLTLSFREPGR